MANKRIEDQYGNNPVDLVGRTIHTLEQVAGDLGLDDAQTQAKLDELFSAYPGEWCIYFAVRAKGAILDAIAADTSLPWLDTDINGETLRARMIRRINRY